MIKIDLSFVIETYIIIVNSLPSRVSYFLLIIIFEISYTINSYCI